MNGHILLLDNKQGDGGGGGHYLFNLARLLLDAGCQVDVAFLLASADSSLRDDLKEIGAQVHDIAQNAIRPPEAAEWLARFLESEQVDILHVNWGGPEMRETLASWDVEPWWRGGRLYTLHLPLESPGSLASWTFRDWLPFSWKRKKRKRLAEFFNRFDQIISVSNYNAHESRRLYHLPADKITFVPNGVDVARFSPRDASPPDSSRSQVVIGACSRLARQKRLDMLIRAFARIDSRTGAELRIAGAGDEEGSLRALCDELGVTARIHFVGFQPDASEFLRGLDVFALTSDREGLPYAVLEAMACGLPSVVTGVNDVPFVVRDGVDGFVIPCDDPPACAGRLSQLLADPQLRQQMGASARERVCGKFSDQAWRTHTLQVYQQLGLQPCGEPFQAIGRG